jgi:hypothetical protein
VQSYDEVPKRQLFINFGVDFLISLLDLENVSRLRLSRIFHRSRLKLLPIRGFEVPTCRQCIKLDNQDQGN